MVNERLEVCNIQLLDFETILRKPSRANIYPTDFLWHYSPADVDVRVCKLKRQPQNPGIFCCWYRKCKTQWRAKPPFLVDKVTFGLGILGNRFSKYLDFTAINYLFL